MFLALDCTPVQSTIRLYCTPVHSTKQLYCTSVQSTVNWFPGTYDNMVCTEEVRKYKHKCAKGTSHAYVIMVVIFLLLKKAFIHGKLDEFYAGLGKSLGKDL